MMTASATTILMKDGPKTAAMASGKISAGMERKTSTTRDEESVDLATDDPRRTPHDQPDEDGSGDDRQRK